MLRDKKKQMKRVFLGVKLEKVSIFLVLSLQTNVLANGEVSVLPLLRTVISSYTGLKI